MASTLYQTTGIVLGRRDHREVDRLYTVLTREHGKVEFLARGGHKPLAKLTPHLEMMGEVELLLVKGRYWQTVAGVERQRNFNGIYTQLTKLVLAQNAAHLIDIGTRTHEADEDLYQLLTNWLVFLDEAPELSDERAAYLLGGFTLKLMALVGYRPELTSCLSCRQFIQPAQYRFHGLRGGVVCRSCATKDERTWFAARNMTDTALKLVRFCLDQPFEAQLRPRLVATDIQHFHETVESLIIAHFPTIPASSLRASCRLC